MSKRMDFPFLDFFPGDYSVPRLNFMFRSEK